jgi:hypothetical protein
MTLRTTLYDGAPPTMMRSIRVGGALRATTQICVAVIATLIASGCAAGSAESEPGLGPVPMVRSPGDIVLPLDAYEPTAQQQTTYLNAYELLAKKCAQRYHIDYSPGAVEVVDPEIKDERRYGIILESDATEWGYRPPLRMQPKKSKKEQGWNPIGDEFMVVTGVDPRTRESWEGRLVNGVPVAKDGCTGEAGRHLGAEDGKADELAALTNSLAGEAYTRSRKDSRTLAAWAQWSKCMKASGYEFAEPFEANDKFSGPDLTQEEIALAVIDVKCKLEHNVVGRWMAVEIAYQNRLLEQNAERLEKSKQAYERRLAKAAAALGRVS